MKERMNEIWYWVEDKLKELCGEITPDKRLTVILIMLLLFTISNLYFSISSIYDWGKEEEKKHQLKIEHIRKLELDRYERNNLIDSEPNIEFPDSMNQQNSYDYERSNEG